MFRTVIRENAKRSVDFGGHYTIAAYGCGAGCTAFYVVDSIGGRVYDGFGVADLPGAWLEKAALDLNRLEYHPNSRLLKVNGCPNETNCGLYDYVIVEAQGLKLVQKELLPEKF